MPAYTLGYNFSGETSGTAAIYISVIFNADLFGMHRKNHKNYMCVLLIRHIMPYNCMTISIILGLIATLKNPV